MTIEQIRGLVVETEKYLKGLSMWQANEGKQGCPPNQDRNQGILGNSRGTQRGTGRHSQGRPFRCFKCQQFGHMACECQNPMVPCSSGQQFTSTPAQGFNVHMQMFVPAPYQATVSLVLQPVCLDLCHCSVMLVVHQ